MNPLQRVLAYLFIVPESHVRVLDFRFQAEMYALFHRRVACWLGHVLCTPLIVTCMLGGASFLPFAPLDAAVAGTLLPGGLAIPLALGFLGFYVLVERTTAPVMAVLLGLALLAANALVDAWGADALRNLALAAAGLSFVQTVSHAAEDVPPPLSGSNAFTHALVWLRSVPPARVAGTLLLAPVFTVLEFWASPRVWQLQVLEGLLALGWKPSLRATLDERIREIVDADVLGNVRWRPGASG